MTNIGSFPRVPRHRQPSKLQVSLIILGLIIFAVVLVFRNAAVFYTDYLWFQSVDLYGVWSDILVTKIALGAIAVVLTFILLWVTIWIADRSAPRLLSPGREDELARQYQRVTRKRPVLIRTLVALGLAVFVSAGFSTHWRDWLLFRNGGDFGIKDPQFHTDIGFFVFRLPFLTTVIAWLFYSLAFSILLALAVHYLQGSIRPQAPSNRVGAVVKMHISILLGLLALVRAAQYYLDRYELSYSTRGVVLGANYTDVQFLLPAFGLLILISVTAGLSLFLGARSRSWSWPAITIALWAIVSILIGTLIPAGVQKFSVEPAEPQKEGPYIARNIAATRHAFNLDGVKVNNFAYTNDLTATDLQNNAQTIRNVRLWDPKFAAPSYKRLQENRSFFQFSDIDIDRYPLNDQTTQFELAVRELNPAGLPQDRRSWVNQHLAFTHGYGAVASPANAVSSDGAPIFTVKDLPPTGTPPITRPQVYFAEHDVDYSIVSSGQQEVDFTASDGRDQLSRYEGKGGVKLDSIFTKAAFAARVGDLKPLISGLVTESSKAMYLTNIRERAITAAPFLRYDNDPYPVLLDGRILWMQDAYTTSAAYPNAQAADTQLVEGNSRGGGLREAPFNYIRNSVKVVTDAYDGTMTFYVMDNKDPIIKAWQRAFPDLFVDGSTMPSTLREHVRYPEDLFRVQSTMYGSYHLVNATDFYSKSDRWNIAQNPDGRAGSATTTPGAVTPLGSGGEERIEPYYLLMKLPGESRETFLMFQPFVPFSQDDSRKELSSFMVAKGDPNNYGQLESYVMPRGQEVRGPALVEARIQQEPKISQYITLLDQAGSKVKLGNMLIIPVNNTLLYVRPLYVEAQQTKVPEFKKAIVVQGDKIAMEDSLQKALAAIFGSAPATLEQNSGGPLPPGAPPPAQASQPTPTLVPQQNSAQVNALLDQANGEFTKAEQALRNGDLSGYQRGVQAGADLVRRARGG